MKNTFLNTERNVLCGHFPGLVQRETFSSALVLLPQVAHHHHWFLNMMTQTSYLYLYNRYCVQWRTHLTWIFLHTNVKATDYPTYRTQTVTHLLTRATAECLLHTSLLHLNILILIHTFLWVFLNFNFRVGRDPVKIHDHCLSYFFYKCGLDKTELKTNLQNWSFFIVLPP